ncbi:MAG TPA: metalloregulator ArsR/SmtB family transcription factor [Gaiellaceae bacterium]|jgi:DNA-binding transcriptional ArsR family regulator|nr:metalloregulator ArsR/SmtB family transcription factor [Gaiellaceae bacterium]
MPRVAARTDAFHAISEGNRRVLLDLLREGERPVGALVAETGLSYSLASQHLQVLLEAGVVARRPEGRQRIYRLEAAPLRVVHDWTVEYERFWEERIGRLQRRLAEQ